MDELLTASSSAGVPRGEGAQCGLRQAILESGRKKQEPLSQMQMTAQAANCGRRHVRDLNNLTNRKKNPH